MKIYAYRMVSDNGFAPYPAKGLCTLACCKPKIRQAIGDSIVEEFRKTLFSSLGFAELQKGNGAIKDQARAERLLTGRMENEAERKLSAGISEALNKSFAQEKEGWTWEYLKKQCNETFHGGVDGTHPNTLASEAKESFTTALLEAAGFPNGLMTTAAIRKYFKDHPAIGTFDDFITKMDIYVIGLVGKTMKGKGQLAEGSIVYCMKVTDVMDFAEYWEREPSRKPDHKYFEEHARNDGKYGPANCGDNIYEFRAQKDDYSIKATPSFHFFKYENPEPQMLHDLGGTYVLASSQFVYFGREKESAKVSVPLCKGREHTVPEFKSVQDFKSGVKLKSGSKLKLDNAQIAEIRNALNGAERESGILGAPIGSNGIDEKWWNQNESEESK